MDRAERCLQVAQNIQHAYTHFLIDLCQIHNVCPTSVSPTTVSLLHIAQYLQ